MEYIDWFIAAWLIIISVWIMFFPMKEGRQGERGEQGRTGYANSWEMEKAMLECLDNAEYMNKLIQKINSYQLHGGEKIDKK